MVLDFFEALFLMGYGIKKGDRLSATRIAVSKTDGKQIDEIQFFCDLLSKTCLFFVPFSNLLRLNL